MTITVMLIHPLARPDHVGMIPSWLDLNDPRSAKEQLNEGYAHGGGWHSFSGFTMDKNTGAIKFPGDPPHPPLASIVFRDELIVIYEHAWVAIVQPDGSFEICRMD
jgi:hypothetical protein